MIFNNYLLKNNKYPFIMKNMEGEGVMIHTSTFFLKSAIILIGLTVAGLSIFGLPELAAFSAVKNPGFAHLKLPVLLGLYATEIPFFLVLYQAFRLIDSIKTGTAFTVKAADTLIMIKICAWIISGIYFIGALFLLLQGALHPGIAVAGLLIVFASMTISVFAEVLHEMLWQALEMKLDNELTV
jgi:Protein of unknown function (DUF2975)